MHLALVVCGFFTPANSNACSIGRNVKLLIDRTDEEYCFRLQKSRVYYVRLVCGLCVVMRVCSL